MPYFNCEVLQVYYIGMKNEERLSECTHAVKKFPHFNPLTISGSKGKD